MFRTILRVTTLVVTFFLGWTVFQIVRPAAEVPAVARAPVQILSITLKRHGCVDDELQCPVYDVTFRSNGSGTFVGYKNNDDYDGKFNTVFDPQDFAMIADEFQKRGFQELPQQYATSPEQEPVVLEVVTDEGLRAFTTANWQSTPNDLRVMEALVDGLSYRVTWADAE